MSNYRYFILSTALGLTAIFFIVSGITGNSSSDCDDLPGSYSSYEEAHDLILNAKYSFTDECNTSRSSWIRSAEFLSCDGNTGFFVFGTDKKRYIHQDVPLSVWNNFCSAESLGRYYNQNLKGNYQLKLK